MNWIRPCLIAVVALWIAWASVHAYAAPDEGAITPLPDRIKQHLQATDFSGACLVTRSETVLYRAGHGMANEQLSTPITPETLFETASITKLVTKLVLLRLAEEGCIEFDDPISDHLPGEIPKHWRNVTLLQLAEHTSGMPRGGSGQGPNLNKAALDHLDATPVFSPPGSGYAYSNSAFAVLAAIIQNVTGLTYEDACRKYILAPAGVAERTLFSAEKTALPLARANRGTGRSANRDPYPTPTDPVYGAEYKGMGGWCASIDTLAELLHAILGDRVISPRSRALLFVPTAQREDRTLFHERFRFGADGQLCYAVGGGVSGFTSKLWWFPESQTLIVMLSNEDPSSFNWDILVGVKSLVFDEPVPPPMPKPEPIEREELIGRYVSTVGTPDGVQLELVLREEGAGVRAELRLLEAARWDGTRRPTFALASRKVLDALQDSDFAKFATTVTPRLRDEFHWPDRMEQLYWPAHVERNGPMSGYRLLGFTTMVGGLTYVWYTADHEISQTIGIIGYTRMHEVQYLELDLNRTLTDGTLLKRPPDVWKNQHASLQTHRSRSPRT